MTGKDLCYFPCAPKSACPVPGRVVSPTVLPWNATGNPPSLLCLFCSNIHASSQLFTILFPALWDDNPYVRVIINVYGNWTALFRQLNVMFKQEEVSSLQLIASVSKGAWKDSG